MLALFDCVHNVEQDGLPTSQMNSLSPLSIFLYSRLSLPLYADKPLFSPPKEAFSLLEGSAAVINMTAMANPPPVSYEWLKDVQGDDGHHDNKDVFSTSRIRVQNGILDLSEVRRQDAGYYTVKATNDEGTSQTKIEIDVQYPARYSNNDRSTTNQKNVFIVRTIKSLTVSISLT